MRQVSRVVLKRVRRSLSPMRRLVPLPDGVVLRVRWLFWLDALALVPVLLVAGDRPPSTPLVGLVVAAALPGFISLTLTMHALRRTLRRHHRALERERVLRRAGAWLVGATDRKSVFAAVRAAVVELGRDLPGLQMGVVLIEHGEARIVAAAGRNEQALLGTRLDFDAVPAHLRGLFAAGETTWLPRFSAAALAPALGGLDLGITSLASVPLVLSGVSYGAISLGADGTIPSDLVESMRTVANKCTLALGRVRLSEDLRASEARFRTLVNNASDVIVTSDRRGMVRYISPSVERILGRRPEDLVGFDVGQHVHPEDLPRVREVMREVLHGAESCTVECRIAHADGSWRHFETLTANLLDDPDVRAVVLNARDITERKHLEEQLRHQALHDSLTALANRTLLHDRLEHAMRRVQRSGAQVALLLVDLDDFKDVNDSYGHAAGDLVLLEVSQRLQSCLRPADTLARLGGDEFAVLLEDVDGLSSPQRIAARIVEALEQPFDIFDGAGAVTRASIGIALSGPDVIDFDQLLRNADVAMYHAKQRGKGRWDTFEPGMRESLIRRMSIEAELRRAVERDELMLHYQPVVAPGHGSVASVEALLRWSHPTLGTIAPGDFIPVAESSGMIVAIGHWVLLEACRQLRRWRDDRAPGDLGVSVNISPRQLQDPELVSRVRTALAAGELEPAALTLEVTESAMMDDIESAIARLADLRHLGVRIAIDDFGTGHSSLSQLQRLPVDVLKVDGSFVAHHPTDAATAGVVRSIVELGRMLDLDVVVEGAETAEQAAMVASLGGDVLLQGYHLSRPLPAEELRPLLGRAVQTLTA